MVMHVDPDEGNGGGGISRPPAIVYVTTGITNPGFEEGDTGWSTTSPSGWMITTAGSDVAVYRGAYSANLQTGRTGSVTNLDLINNSKIEVTPGKVINARGRCYGGGKDGNVASIILVWYDSADAIISVSPGNSSNYGSHRTWDISTVRGVAPAGAASVSIGFRGTARTNGVVAVDEAEWDYAGGNAVTLTSPSDGSVYQYGENIPFSVSIVGTNPYATHVDYVDATDSIITTSAVPPFSGASSTLSSGEYDVRAIVSFSDASQIQTDPVHITITQAPPAPSYIEYAASNAYSYLILDNISGIASQMPVTSKVTGVEINILYTMEILTRSKDKDVDDPQASTYKVVFDMINEGKVEAILLQKNGEQFTATGNPMYGQVPIDIENFSFSEAYGPSEGMYLTRYTYNEGEGDPVGSTSIGSNPSFYSPEQSLFGLPPISVTDFLNRAIGLRFIPTIGSIPAYADSGDAVIRFGFAGVSMAVYFDAGSALYYFTNNGGTVLSGELVHYIVENGNLRNGDASGFLQLRPDITLYDGSATDPLTIGFDISSSQWTIHAAYPPSDDNKIGNVVQADFNSTGMQYNELPSQYKVLNNYSRYEFITSNFYGDENLASIYGVNGVGRAFAYNGDFFYNIQDYPFNNFDDTDPTLKDRPRHIANHHSHLALGFGEGRVDLSVIGKPYSFDGLLGASSWALGDNVTGLLPLSGTILGIFCGSSVWGISGTTVDNFTTQIISPKMGATEYTVADMGFPVYANSYGIYTLAQTQQYGDYLGVPMSQAVSPWLRPRLIRENNFTTVSDLSDKQIVCAWPVRSKNQYKIGFADGAVLSMTINSGSQSAPTFSFQNYTVYTDEELDVVTGVSLDPGQALNV